MWVVLLEIKVFQHYAVLVALLKHLYWGKNSAAASVQDIKHASGFPDSLNKYVEVAGHSFAPVFLVLKQPNNERY